MRKLFALLVALVLALPVQAGIYGPGSYGDGFIKTPSTITNPDSIQPAHLLSWFRADSGVTEGTGGVSEWADKRGSGYALGQSASGQRPALVASSSNFNNLPTLEFTQANNDFLVATSYSDLPDEVTIVVVGSATGTNEQVFADIGLDSGFATGPLAYYDGANMRFFVEGTFASYADATPVSPAVHIFRYNGSETRSDIFKNSTTSLGDASPGALTNTLNRLTVGIAGSQAAWPMGGEIAEIMIWDKKLTDAELASVLGYTNARYGF